MAEKENPALEQRVFHPRWSACPNCSRDLGAKPIGSKPPHTFCPFCGVQLIHVWWQRVLVSALALVLTFAIPASLGIRGIMSLLFAGVLCVFPALVIAMILVFKVIPPKYVRKSEAVMINDRDVKSTCPVSAAGSDGRCNTIYCFDSTMLAWEK
jgi:hypothetical protein